MVRGYRLNSQSYIPGIATKNFDVITAKWDSRFSGIESLRGFTLDTDSPLIMDFIFTYRNIWDRAACGTRPPDTSCFRFTFQLLVILKIQCNLDPFLFHNWSSCFLQFPGTRTPLDWSLFHFTKSNFLFTEIKISLLQIPLSQLFKISHSLHSYVLLS